VVDGTERADLIRRYRDGHRAVVEALRDLKSDELDRSTFDEWTPRQIAHHLADSEMVSAIRLRRLVAEDRPTLMGYDEKEFARRLTSDRPIEPSLEAMRWARETSAQILERLTDDDWRRTGTHEESGPYSVERWLQIYADHGHQHSGQIRRARGQA